MDLHRQAVQRFSVLAIVTLGDKPADAQRISKFKDQGDNALRDSVSYKVSVAVPPLLDFCLSQ